jgi:hypothetical protein
MVIKFDKDTQTGPSVRSSVPESENPSQNADDTIDDNKEQTPQGSKRTADSHWFAQFHRNQEPDLFRQNELNDVPVEPVPDSHSELATKFTDDIAHLGGLANYPKFPELVASYLSEHPIPGVEVDLRPKNMLEGSGKASNVFFKIDGTVVSASS